jgi:hypothetical protein
VSVQSAKRVGAPDTKNPAMSFLYTYRSSPDTKLESGEEQVQSKWGHVLIYKQIEGIEGTIRKISKPVAVLRPRLA